MSIEENICDILHSVGDSLCPGKYEEVHTPPIPIFKRILTLNDVANIVHQLHYKYYQPLDKHYKEITFESMQRFLNFDKVSEKPYIKEYHDCDNYAIELAGHVSEWCGNAPFGIVFLKGHAINCFISDGVLYFIEPQDDTVYTTLGDNQVINFIVL